LLVLFYLWLFRRQRHLVGGRPLGVGPRTSVNPDTVRVSFDDIAGSDEVTDEISEVVDFLCNRGSTALLGARRRTIRRPVSAAWKQAESPAGRWPSDQ
jgi:cell division protease FtsH